MRRRRHIVVIFIRVNAISVSILNPTAPWCQNPREISAQWRVKTKAFRNVKIINRSMKPSALRRVGYQGW